MTDFQISANDRSTGLWLRLKAHLEERLALARLRNDKLLPEYETAMLRGEIACLKRLIALGDVRPLVTGDGEGAP